MNDVIMLAREYERLLTVARKVVRDWRASQQMAGMDESTPTPPKWASLAELEGLVNKGELP